ncbi:SRPBCC family protein [Thermomonospora umbrina]|uniref:Carbon monoxide dehydrogenase subunit G n=1 Tax=Thermomonospora umbrina TaxID=111806 RepID=A0A3D9SUN8_9ACTN|nr:SRPBCC family protein [Thermomonospora umbrina]REE98210.1 carbon monoxide dehydrogenase subunit G [Thermomonospora umbrina]
MELDHEFTVPVPVDQTWSALLDVERVARCMPGATLDSTDGEEHTGRFKVRLGAMTITYRGTAALTEADEPARTITVKANGKEARGSGTASALFKARLTETDGATRVTIHTSLDVTGRPAQFGRTLLTEAAAKILTRFAKSLETELHPEPGPAPAPDTEAAPQPTAAPLPEPTTAPVTEPEPEGASQRADAGDAAQGAVAERLGEPDLGPEGVGGPATGSGGESGSEPAAEGGPEVEVVRGSDEGGVGEVGGTVSVPRPREGGQVAEGGVGFRAEPSVGEGSEGEDPQGRARARRAAPAVGALAALLAVRYLFRRRRGRHRR